MARLGMWLKFHNMPINRFAEKIGKNKSLVHKYIYEGVIPKKDVMKEIFVETFGAVTANDFYDLSNDLLKEKLKKKSQFDEFSPDAFA